MKTNERVCSRLSRQRVRAVGLALLVAACGGTVGQAPILGSESHFLAYCDSTCGAGLECIGGICTRSCLTDSSSCSDLGSGAQCTNQSVEPGQVAVCDVACTLNLDCAPLGTGYGCEGGYCRSKALLEQPVSTGSGGSGGSGGTAGGGGSGGSGAANSGADSALCEDFRDQSPPPDIREIAIVNTGSVALYILPVVKGCEASSLLEVERDGQVVNVLAGDRCEDRCQDVIDAGGVAHTCPVAPPCSTPAPVLIEPGQTLTQPAGLEVIQQSLPRSCAPAITTDTRDCYARVIPQPGNYLLTVRTSRGLDCEADPGASGCDNPFPVFTFPSDWYFQNQVLNIAAP